MVCPEKIEHVEHIDRGPQNSHSLKTARQPKATWAALEFGVRAVLQRHTDDYSLVFAEEQSIATISMWKKIA